MEKMLLTFNLLVVPSNLVFQSIVSILWGCRLFSVLIGDLCFRNLLFEFFQLRIIIEYEDDGRIGVIFDWLSWSKMVDKVKYWNVI